MPEPFRLTKKLINALPDAAEDALDGMDAPYVDTRQLFGDLLASQEVLTAKKT